MAEAPYSFDQVTFDKNVKSIQEFQMTYQGKKNHNPYLWLHKNLRPITDDVAKGNKTKANFDAVAKMATTKEVPIIDPNYKELTPEQMGQVVQQPRGISLPKKQ